MEGSTKVKLVVLVGPPGSGKSTYSWTLRDYARVSQDDHGKEGHWELFNNFLNQGLNIVVDRMNFSKEQRARYLDAAKAKGYETEIRIFAMGYDDCLMRMAPRLDGRQKHATIQNEENARNALHVFFTRFERPQDEEADDVLWGTQSIGGIPCIVVDLDGTLCNIEHRLHHVRTEGKKDWVTFFKECVKDEMHLWCMELIRAMADREHEIVFASGRAADQCGAETKKWLDDRLRPLGIPYTLFMRHGRDFRRDDVVKEIILDFEILPKFDPLFVVDDRKQVVDMWRSRGLTCLQCAPGDF